MRRTGRGHSQRRHSKATPFSVYVKVAAQFLFYFIGTYLHELAHWAACKLVGGRVMAFHLIPRIKKGYIIYGSVQSQVAYRAMFMPIALAPLLWWGVLYYFLLHMDVLTVVWTDSQLAIGIAYQQFSDWTRWWIIYIALQLLWAGRPSDQDLAVFWQGLFSVSGLLVVLVVVGAIIYFS